VDCEGTPRELLRQDQAGLPLSARGHVETARFNPFSVELVEGLERCLEISDGRCDVEHRIIVEDVRATAR
jgi:hypothetical protein